MPLLPRGRTRAAILTRVQLLQGSRSDREAQLRPYRDGHPEIKTEDDGHCRHSLFDGPIIVRFLIPPPGLF